MVRNHINSSNLNILISHSSLFKKAGWGRIFPLAVGLAKNGNSVCILTTNPKFSLFIKQSIIEDVKVIMYPEIIPARISRMGFGFLSLFFKIMHVLFHRYDIVHSDNGHRPLSGIPCRLHKKIYGSVYVAEWYDWYGKGGQYDSKKKIFKLLLGRYELKYEIKDKMIADGIVVLSEILRTRAGLFKPTNRIVKIHGGADVSGLPFLKENSFLKEKYNINKDTITFGYINSDSYRLDEILPLINTLINNKLSSKFKILLFGKSNLLIEQLPSEMLDQIIFFGWIDFEEEYEKLQLVDVFFLFKEETLGNKAGWPNCVGDYMACGRPIMLNPVGEVIDFVKYFPSGFIISTRDEDDIYQKIKYIMANSPQLKEKGTIIRKFAEENVSWEKKSIELYDFYIWLLENRNSSISVNKKDGRSNQY